MSPTLDRAPVRFATVDGRRMRYRSAKAGPPAVLLHGIERSETAPDVGLVWGWTDLCTAIET